MIGLNFGEVYSFWAPGYLVLFINDPVLLGKKSNISIFAIHNNLYQ